MRPIWHLGLALLLSVATLVFFTLSSGYGPNPEELSPLMYLVAAILGFWAVWRLKGRRGFWGFLLIPLLAVFGFLEEISYGMELGWYEPFYVGSPDLLFQDFHNFIHIFLRWAERQLGLGEWNGNLLGQFLLIMGFVVLLAAAWIFGIRSVIRKQPKKTQQQKLFSLSLAFSAVISFICAGWLLLIPVDPKNAVLFGLSSLRLAQVLFLSLTGLLALIALSRLNHLPSGTIARSVTTLFAKPRLASLVRWVAILALFASLVTAIAASFNSAPESVVFIERLMPVLAWGAAQSLLLLLTSNHHFFMRDWPHVGRSFAEYVNARPYLVYVALAVVLLLVAQALDRDYFYLPNTRGTSSGVLARDWHVWTEENSEFAAALLLAVASLFIYLKPPKS